MSEISKHETVLKYEKVQFQTGLKEDTEMTIFWAWNIFGNRGQIFKMRPTILSISGFIENVAFYATDDWSIELRGMDEYENIKPCFMEIDKEKKEIMVHF